MLKRTASVFIVACWLAQPAFGFGTQDQHDRCMAASEGVTVAMLDCIAVALDDAETDVGKSQDKLSRSVTAEFEIALALAQEEWAAYRSSTCQAESVAAGTGSFSNVALLDCKLRITRERLHWLEGLLAQPDLIDD